MNLYTELCKELEIKYPIIQAPMAGGITTPELVAAVSNAGGLGVLAAGYLTPEATRVEIRKIKKLTERPFAVNIFKAELADSDSRTAEVQEKYASVYEALGIRPGIGDFGSADYSKKQFQVLLEEEIPVLSTTFGLLSQEEFTVAKHNKQKVITMVTNVNEAIQAAKAGADIIVAQGSDAGGHRGTFQVSDTDGSLVGTMSLVPQVADAVELPVVAAGGIMDGRGLAASMVLGAAGVQLGTRFLHAAESGTDEAYKQALLEADEDSTTITKSFSGRPARAVKNEFTELHSGQNIKPLKYPGQNNVTGEIRKAAKKQGNKEYLSLWSGQGIRMIKEEQSAKEIINDIMEQAARIIYS
ncbi:nitronate monooxygenase [Evansella sp. LMS18]|uniref:NAD(P)H-dependent flavin oxidoreductase n=1 Tax=Evansella sp. LMS18 TaxID=2924033 RepID=UPI0020D01167|nr:nitronate monooxygenase [Evansella sp. LMS18]UTR10657.1 nitronate monooxygenase [Evansella sp. LMS18]